MLPNVVGIVLGNAVGGLAHGLDGAPTNQRVRIESQGNKTTQDTLLSYCHFGNLFEAPLVEQFTQGVLDR